MIHDRRTDDDDNNIRAMFGAMTAGRRTNKNIIPIIKGKYGYPTYSSPLATYTEIERETYTGRRPTDEPLQTTSNSECG